jgi:hypothetical protein
MKSEEELMTETCKALQDRIVSGESSLAWSTNEQEHLKACERCHDVWMLHHQAVSLGEHLREARQMPSAPDASWILQRTRRAAEARRKSPRGTSVMGSMWGSLASALGVLAIVWFVSSGMEKPFSSQPQVTPRQKAGLSQNNTPKAKKVSPAILAKLMQDAWRAMDAMTQTDDDPPFAETKPVYTPEETWAMQLHAGPANDVDSPAVWLLNMTEPSLNDLDPAPISQDLPDSLQGLEGLIQSVALQTELDGSKL